MHDRARVSLLSSIPGEAKGNSTGIAEDGQVTEEEPVHGWLGGRGRTSAWEKSERLSGCLLLAWTQINYNFISHGSLL